MKPLFVVVVYFINAKGILKTEIQYALLKLPVLCVVVIYCLIPAFKKAS